MNLSEAKARRDAVTARMLVLDAKAIESKRAWFSEGQDTPLAERLAVESERAKLAVERHELSTAIRASEDEERKQRRATAFAVLVDLLNERGLGDLVVEANRIADERSTTAKEAST
jgi:hypothetical protein